MGDSMPPSADFDLVGSYARRRGGDAELVFAQPTGDVPSATTVVLRRKDREVTARAAVTERAGRPALVATIARGELADGIWGLRLGADGPRLAARLLVQGERPLVLLWGADDPRSRVPRPSNPRDARGRAIATAGRAADAAMRVLPADRATKLRGSIRKAARRALG
ncbi:hypothetical protein [Jatrophihabitans fulvus]